MNQVFYWNSFKIINNIRTSKFRIILREILRNKIKVDLQATLENLKNSREI